MWTVDDVAHLIEILKKEFIFIYPQYHMILGDNKYYINYKTLLYLFIVAYKYSKRFIQQVVQLAV